MTDLPLVQRVWFDHYEACQQDMFSGYQEMLFDDLPSNSPVQEHGNLPASNYLPTQQSLPPAPNLMPPVYSMEPPSISMSQNLPELDQFSNMQNIQAQQEYALPPFLPYRSPMTASNLPMSQNVTMTPEIIYPEYTVDPTCVPLPEDIPLPQNVPFLQDMPIPQCIEQSPEYIISRNSELARLLSRPPSMPPTSSQLPHAGHPYYHPDHTSRKRVNPRELRNKAEKERRDKLNRSIAELASMVPPVKASPRKIDRIGVLRLTAHYLRAYDYVFSDVLAEKPEQLFTPSSVQTLLKFFNGFLLTVTYKGIIVLISENIQQHLGYKELELLYGNNILSITHKDDHDMLLEQIMPNKELLGPNGELLVPNEPDGIMKVSEALSRDKRRFIVRFKKYGVRSEPAQYIQCHVEGCFRKSDKACKSPNPCCKVRRARSRIENYCTSGNDVVFIGMVRPDAETFLTEIRLESSRMEYRTRHSIDGEIIQCDQRIALATGYMIHEVQGVNAMNFMHRDDVYWVIMALRDMYQEHHLYGESCYRLMTKNGEFIYMRTRGKLDVGKDTGVVTSFVCTNTVVDEAEGKHLVKMMKKKYDLKKKKGELLKLTKKEDPDKEELPVEDPRQLEKVILNLVRNLPVQSDGNLANMPATCGASTSRCIAIIPPKKERIVSAIEKMYNVIKYFPKDSRQEDNPLLDMTKIEEKCEEDFNSPSTYQSPANETELSSYATSSSDGYQDEIYFQNLINSAVQIPTTCVCAGPVYTDFDSMMQPIEPTPYTFITPRQVDEYPNENFFPSTANQSAVELKCQVFVAPNIDMPPTSTKGSLKRPNECIECNKKKHSSMKIVSDDNSPDDDFSCLEALFDEEMLDKQIESAMKSYEQNFDPTFADLLVSSEIQDILDQIEKKQNVDITGA